MSAIRVIYSPVNQAYFIMWFNEFLAIHNTLDEVDDYLEFLEGR